MTTATWESGDRIRTAPRTAARHAERPAETLDGLFVRAARRSPDAVAVQEGPQHITYANADRRSAQLATALVHMGVQLGDPVIVQCSDHRQALVAHLAVLKAGGVCVPARWDASAAHTGMIAALSGAGVVLCSLVNRGRWGAGVPRLALDDPELWKRVGALRVDRALPRSAPTDAAYLLAGPQDRAELGGHLVDHRAWQLALGARTAQIGAAPQAVAVAEPPTGPAALSAMWWTFASGSTVHARADEPGLFATTARHGMGVAVCDPRTYALSLDAMGGQSRSLRPRMVLLVGGPCRPELVARHFESLPMTRLRAEFAPSDGVLPWTAKEFNAEPETREVFGTVGSPLPDIRLHVLDALGRPLGTGRTGELCATGRPLPFDVIGGRGSAVAAPGGGAPSLLRSGLMGRRRLDGSLQVTGCRPAGRREPAAARAR
ncbi:AMP-binding protein [Streptomyces coeruleorubidus]|uniref:AMP-binding protein n=1 Tax=Streptomyces coeruleorubidus TaxID=116188 RepID=UPI0037A9F5A2